MPAVKSAVENDGVTVACAYVGHVPQEVLKLLPEGFAARQYVAAIENGKITRLITGLPEDVIGRLLPHPAEAQPVTRKPKECEDCLSEGDCEDCNPADKPAS